MLCAMLHPPDTHTTTALELDHKDKLVQLHDYQEMPKHIWA